jgi:hypothetical protein
MLLALLVFFSASSMHFSENESSSCHYSCSPDSQKEPNIFFPKLYEGVLHFGAATAFETLSRFSRLGLGVSLLTPWASTLGKEFLLMSELCGSVSEQLFTKFLQGEFLFDHFVDSKRIPFSQLSWHQNQKLLSQIPADTDEEKQLLFFLEKRWLAKITGFFPLAIDKICPCFDISMQAHPETANSYARTPSSNFSPTYIHKIQDWKKILPHPQHYPLILTRPYELRDYLPNYLEVASEDMPTTLKRIGKKLQEGHARVVLDLSALFSEVNSQQWLTNWKAYQDSFLPLCKENKIDPKKILCMQRVKHKETGGIRLLPFATATSQETEQNHQYLLEWISCLGLTTNRIEMDRGQNSSPIQVGLPVLHPMPSRDEFLATVNNLWQNFPTHPTQTAFLIKAPLLVLTGLLAEIPESKWEEITQSKTRASLIELSLTRMEEQLELLRRDTEETPFFETTSHLEEIHANLSVLIEIFSPYTAKDFSEIYSRLLTTIPSSLKNLTTCGIHSSGMTSLAGIIKTVEHHLGRTPNVIYGHNTYFECINSANKTSKALSLLAATEEDWQNVDLILAQFNPVIIKTHLPSNYSVEPVSAALRKALICRQGKPFTVAIDSTIDWIDSTRVSILLEEFQKEIQEGLLNVISYRSGLKFDLLGMDNYSGAPAFMIHNQEAKWSSFDSLFQDPLLQADRLSVNWFCLSYKYASFELQQFQKQIIENTKALLAKVPSRLFNKDVPYRLISFDKDADPTFIDIRITGPFHQIRGSALVGGCLYVKCLERQCPIFNRLSFGFYHPNFTMLFDKDYTTIRLTLGPDPAQVELLADCFEKIDALNGS